VRTYYHDGSNLVLIGTHTGLGAKTDVFYYAASGLRGLYLRTFNNTGEIVLDNVSVRRLNKACVWTNIGASNWLRGIGQMQLTLDAVASDVVDYDNSLGDGDINVGIDCNELSRRTGAFAVVTNNGEEVTNNGYVVYE